MSDLVSLYRLLLFYFYALDRTSIKKKKRNQRAVFPIFLGNFYSESSWYFPGVHLIQNGT